MIIGIGEVEGNPPTPGTSLSFADPMNQDFIESDDYVLFGKSRAAAIPGVMVFEVNNTPPPAAVVATDETIDGTDVMVGMTPVMLSRLVVQHDLGTASAADVEGDVFAISLFSDPAFEEDAFLNSQSNPVPYRLGTAGTITVRAAAIPEPGAFALGCLGMIASCIPRRSRRIVARIPAGDAGSVT